MGPNKAPKCTKYFLHMIEIKIHFSQFMFEINQFHELQTNLTLQIEEVIYMFPGIADVGVFGVPNNYNEKHVAVAVVKKPNEVLHIGKLLKHMDDSLEPYSHLCGNLFVVDSLPRSPQGKLLRRILVAMFKKQAL